MVTSKWLNLHENIYNEYYKRDGRRFNSWLGGMKTRYLSRLITRNQGVDFRQHTIFQDGITKYSNIGFPFK